MDAPIRMSEKGSHHELAAELMRGRLSYPTIVFLDEELNVIQPIPGYQNPVDFQMILMYFADNYFRRISTASLRFSIATNESVNLSMVTTDRSAT